MDECKLDIGGITHMAINTPWGAATFTVETLSMPIKAKLEMRKRGYSKPVIDYLIRIIFC